MNVKQKFSEFEQDSKILEAIASGYDRDSSNYAALKRATIALCYTLTERYEEFTKYIDNWDAELTPEQSARLSSPKVDPSSHKKEQN